MRARPWLRFSIATRSPRNRRSWRRILTALYGFRTVDFAKQLPTRLLRHKQAVQRPIAVQCIQEAAPTPSWKTKPSWFLIAEEDRMINPKTQHFMADRMRAKVHSYPVDHSPMYSEPNLVINIILEAARETLSS